MIYNVCITKAVVSPGYDKTEALKFSENGESVRFRIGIPHYDANAENNTYWENENVKAFGSVCEQIKKMKLKEGSVIALCGEKIFDSWEDEEGEIKHTSAIKASKVDYAGSGKRSDSDDEAEAKSQPTKPKASGSATKAKAQPKQPATESENFDGYAPIGGYDDFC